MRIAETEFRHRIAQFGESVGPAGLDGALVFSRGGGTYDRSGDVLYLTGHYQAWVNLPENVPLWSGRSHTAFVVAADGANVLCVSSPEYAPDLVADEIHYSGDFPATVADAISGLGLAGGRLGIVGQDVVPVSMWSAIRSALGSEIEVEPVDHLLAALRRIKSPAEQELIRAASRVGRKAVTAFIDAVGPGVTETEAVAEAVSVVIAEGGSLYAAAASSGDAADRYVARSLPGYSNRPYENGDLVRLDLVTLLDGYFSDFGRTVTVGEPTDDQARLIEAPQVAIDAVIETVKPGITVKELVEAGEAALVDSGVSLDGTKAEPGRLVAAYPPHWGHGLGLGWERPWMTGSEELTVEEGMYLAIERAVSLPGVGTALPEQNLLVRSDGAELLTAGSPGRWD